MTKIQPMIVTLLLTAAIACGQNVVEKYAPANELEKAELDMEKDHFIAATEKLNRVLESDPDNHKARSLLAAAYAAQAGITTLSLIKNAAGVRSSGGTGAKAYTAILPTATLDSLTLMGLACDAMAAIPSNSRTTEMKLQYGLFFSSYAFLQVKYFADNPEALASLTAADAAKLILTLAKASEISGSSPLSTAAASFAATLEQVPGSSVEKVKSAIAANSSGSGG